MDRIISFLLFAVFFYFMMRFSWRAKPTANRDGTSREAHCDHLLGAPGLWPASYGHAEERYINRYVNSQTPQAHAALVGRQNTPGLGRIYFCVLLRFLLWRKRRRGWPSSCGAGDAST